MQKQKQVRTKILRIIKNHMPGKVDNTMSSYAEDFFKAIPNDVLAQVAIDDWNALEVLCNALTIDLQLSKESKKINSKSVT